MVFKRFRLACITRVLLIAATLLVLFYLYFNTVKYATILILGGLLVYQIVDLINFVEKTNRDLTRFLLAIRHSDFSQSFSLAPRGGSYTELSSAFAEVMDEFKRQRAEKEEHVNYLQTVVRHVGIGLIAFDGDGAIQLINNAAKKLFKLPRAGHLEALSSFSVTMVERMQALRSGERALIKVEAEGNVFQLVMYAVEFKMRGSHYTLVSIQNIQSELEEKELEAWQNLIRVLTHEIMNSVTPISSLAATATSLLSDATAAESDRSLPTDERIQDTMSALRTIEKRSQALIGFVDAYRNIMRVPQPEFRLFPVAELFDHLQNLLQAHIDKHEVEMSIEIDPLSLELTADRDLIEQVLINLILNAVDAIRGQHPGQLWLHAWLDSRGRPVIQVRDNGPGIVKEALDRIFIPFYTTKDDGSGIGLSLSRQIMRAHGGTITAASEAGRETSFTLRF